MVDQSILSKNRGIYRYIIEYSDLTPQSTQTNNRPAPTPPYIFINTMQTWLEEGLFRDVFSHYVIPKLGGSDIIFFSGTCRTANRIIHDHDYQKNKKADPVRITSDTDFHQIHQIVQKWHNIVNLHCPARTFRTPTNLTILGKLYSLRLLIRSHCIPASLSEIGRVHHLSLWGEEVTDVSALRNVHHLELNFCQKVTDVSALGTVHHLLLNNCNNIIDVSALSNVRYLEILQCNGVTDVSVVLERVHRLRLIACDSLTNITMPVSSTVRHLSLVSCRKVTDVSALGGVHHLELEYLDITDVSMLGNVHHLVLNGCLLVTDVSALGHVHHLELHFCMNVTDVSALRTVHHLKLISCIGVMDTSMLSGTVHHLEVKNGY